MSHHTGKETKHIFLIFKSSKSKFSCVEHVGGCGEVGNRILNEAAPTHRYLIQGI
jgi:hypothetical protein